MMSATYFQMFQPKKGSGVCVLAQVCMKRKSNKANVAKYKQPADLDGECLCVHLTVDLKFFQMKDGRKQEA